VRGGVELDVGAGVDVPEDKGDEERGDVDVEDTLPGSSIASATASSICRSRWLSAFIKLPLPLSSDFFSKSLILALLDFEALVNLNNTSVMKTGIRRGRKVYTTMLRGNRR